MCVCVCVCVCSGAAQLCHVRVYVCMRAILLDQHMTCECVSCVRVCVLLGPVGEVHRMCVCVRCASVCVRV